MAEKGIDVSRWQGVIDWKKVKDAGIKFAILKATQRGNRTEAKFDTNYTGCRNNKIPAGAYHYVYAKNTAEARAEAQVVINALRGKDIPCGLWLDMEDDSIRNIGKNNLSVIINTEADLIRRAGYGVGIYCNKDWYDNVLDGKVLSRNYYFWIARYPYNDTGRYNEDSSLNPKSYAVMWQYSSKGRISGINEYVDLDAAFRDLTLIMKPQIRPGNNDEGIRDYLQIGDRGEKVKELQKQLEAVGFPCGNSGADGIFGEKTQEAVKKFQEIYGLQVDGLAGPATLSKLNDIYMRVPEYKTGRVYTVKVNNLLVRKTPGGALTGYADLTPDARRNDRNRDGGLDKGTRVTCQGITGENGIIWMKIPSGYIAAFYRGAVYVG